MEELVGTRETYGKTLVELGKENKDIVVLDADTSSSTRTAWFADAYRDRFFNVGIAEANMMGIAAGLASCGKIPFVSAFAVFGTGRALDQIRTSICWPNLPVKIVVTHAGISVGEDGASHQSTEDVAIMRSLPNMTVICPVDGIETEKAVRAAVNIPGPVYIRLGRAKFPLIFSSEYNFKVGKGVLLQEGDDITIISYGIMVAKAMKAAAILADEGIHASVINMSTLKPIDSELIIQQAKKTRAIVTAEEHSIIGGLGSAVAEVLCEYAPVPLRRIGIKDVFGLSGTSDELLNHFGLTEKGIIRACKELLDLK